MTEFVQVPVERLDPDTLGALLEDFASRDGTDYGERETPLDERVAQLRRSLVAGDVMLLFHAATESWDLLPREDAQKLLAENPEPADDP